MSWSRALLTKTERERVSGDGEHSDDQRYQSVSRVRRRINEELPEDVELLREHRPDLFEELQDVVCSAKTNKPSQE